MTCPTCAAGRTEHFKPEAAAHLGITAGTLKTHRFNTGTFPKPDGLRMGSPYWLTETLNTWRAAHPARPRTNPEGSTTR